MKKETILGAIAALCIAFASPVCVYADAAPTITILKGNPSSPTDPPYTFTFRVSDSEGITSIKVNGRELGANGADEYDIDWSTSYNGTFTLTATNTNGGSSSRNLELTNIRSGAPAGASRPAEIPAVTAAPQPLLQPRHLCRHRHRKLLLRPRRSLQRLVQQQRPRHQQRHRQSRKALLRRQNRAWKNIRNRKVSRLRRVWRSPRQQKRPCRKANLRQKKQRQSKRPKKNIRRILTAYIPEERPTGQSRTS